ncbi:phosphofructokinase 5 [Actinidia rufa]|uniref:Phosphofructokinase 5 n=1 Tax=Actinidia rufa TaxID=165716 RepID=A0A7J0DGW2_9ERIC|nr:phosphofructokinase 5 [Actinidia rufa]
MDSLAAAIASKLVVPARNSHFSGGRLLGKPLLRPTSNQISKKIRVHAEKTTPIDFGDPDWKSKFQKDFEARFSIPHLTDVFHDAVPIRSTFCLKMSLMKRLDLELMLLIDERSDHLMEDKLDERSDEGLEGL